jgi:biopolymer transport protein ExbB
MIDASENNNGVTVFMKKTLLTLALIVTMIAVTGLCAQEAEPVENLAKASENANSLFDEIFSFLSKPGTLFDTVKKGGWMMAPIILCSIVAVAIAIQRAVSLRRKLFVPKGFEDKVAEKVRNSGHKAALELCQTTNAHISRVLRAVLLREDHDRQELQTAVQDECENLLYEVNTITKTLGVISSVAPLLGLMGTVWGMIETFNAVADKKGMGNVELLAPGISKALLTTAFGLAVAIPAFLLYHYFKGRAESLIRTTETQAQEFVVALKTNFHEMLKDKPAETPLDRDDTAMVETL